MYDILVYKVLKKIFSMSLIFERTKDLIVLIRPHQWIKNLFLFAPFFFGFHFLLANFQTLIWGFLFFSFAASSLYIFNDLADIKEDQNHPTKKFRPLASGAVNKQAAIILMLCLFSMSVVGAYLLDLDFLYILLVYIIQNLLYSYKLKHISILDISIISIGFVLRILAGSVLIKVQASVWIVLVTFLLSIFLALAKRRDDVLLASDGLATRKSSIGYNLEFVNAGMILASGMTICSYVLYTVQPDVIERFNSKNIYLTSVFVIVGILRYMQITFVENDSGNPTKVLIKDTFLQLVLVGWLLSFLVFFIT